MFYCVGLTQHCACGRIEKLQCISDLLRIEELSVKSDFARTALFTPLGFASDPLSARHCKSSYSESAKAK